MTCQYSFIIKSLRRDPVFYTFKSDQELEDILRPIYDVLKEGISKNGEALVHISEAVEKYIDERIDFLEKTDCIHPKTHIAFVLDCNFCRIYTYRCLTEDSSIYNLESWFNKILMVTRLQ